MFSLFFIVLYYASFSNREFLSRGKVLEAEHAVGGMLQPGLGIYVYINIYIHILHFIICIICEIMYVKHAFIIFECVSLNKYLNV
jgi:hypothetical protein